VPARPRDSRLFLAWASALTVALGALFYAPARVACGGDWPAPLDDVFIHFDFARSWASGHPFEWIAGQGYSSGETSPGYALVLAAGYAVGFKGARLGVWAALVACASLAFAMSAMRRLLPRGPAWVAPLGAPLLFACGTLDFAWFSGMEVALFAAVAAALLAAVDGARRAGPLSRARSQWWTGALGAALVLVRPEAAVVVAVATVAVARRSGAGSPLASSLRVALPGAAVTLGLAAANRLHTGSAAAAGALLKLLSSNPFATDEDRARDYLVNLASVVRAMAHDLGDASGRFAYALPLLALAALASRRTRALGAVCLGGGLAFTLLVSWNGAARYQNFRDYMPPMALVLLAATLGLAAVANRRPLRAVGAGLAVVGVGLGASHVGEAARLYARASRNIHDQQVTVGRRLAREEPAGAIVLVGDAGAIPYLSGLHAVDALGLGGYHGLPFVRAAVHGEAATLELIERLPPSLRPTVLALYPNWFPGITGRFGHETGRVTISDNVICGGVTKGIYDADWQALRGGAEDDAPDEPWGGPLLDELDVADVVSEEAHGYTSPAPRGGWTLLDVRTDATGRPRFDAGRIIPEGEEESFTLAARAPSDSWVMLRTDLPPASASLRVEVAGMGVVSVPLEEAAARQEPRWGLLRARLPGALERGARLHVIATRGSLHDFHVWLVGGNP